jgi:hypothetical protein
LPELEYAANPKHRESAQTKTLARTAIASIGVGAIAISGLTALTVQAEAGTTCPAGTTTVSDRTGTCEVVFTFTETGDRTQVWTTPASVTDFQALLVGGGGASYDDGATVYGGGGSSVTVVRFNAIEEAVEIVVGRGGQVNSQAGSTTVFRVSGQTERTAIGGLGGVFEPFTWGGPGAGGPAGGGDYGENGGLGLSASSFSGEVPLFASSSQCYGGGGAGTGGTVPTCSGGAIGYVPSNPTANSGGGGSGNIFGADGIVIIRFAFGPQPSPRSGSSGAIATPVITSYSKQIVTPGAVVKVTGQLLDSVQSAKVNGKAAKLTAVTSGSLNLRVPAGLPAGTYDLELFGSFGTMLEKSAFTVARKQIKRLVPGFAGNSPVMTAPMVTSIRATLKRLPGAVTLVCTGSTSNTRVTAFDKRLATQRATKACARAKALNPELTTQIRIAPASGVGAQARNIRMVLRNY